MNPKILVPLLIALTAGGTVSAIAVTNPELIGLAPSINWCQGLEFSDTGNATARILNRNPETVSVNNWSHQQSPDNRFTFTLAPLGTHDIATGKGTWSVRTEIVARNEVKMCLHEVTVTAPPEPPREDLFLESAQLVNATDFALYLNNTGSAQVEIVTYYVRNAGVTGVCRVTGISVTIAVNALVEFHARLSGCEWTGTAFDFQAGNTYRVQFVTSLGTGTAFDFHAGNTYRVELVASVGALPP